MIKLLKAMQEMVCQEEMRANKAKADSNLKEIQQSWKQSWMPTKKEWSLVKSETKLQIAWKIWRSWIWKWEPYRDNGRQIWKLWGSANSQGNKFRSMVVPSGWPSVPFLHRARNIFVMDKAGAVLQEELLKERRSKREDRRSRNRTFEYWMAVQDGTCVWGAIWQDFQKDHRAWDRKANSQVYD